MIYVAVSSHKNEYVGYNTHVYVYNNLGANVCGYTMNMSFNYPVNYTGNGVTGGSTAAQTVNYGEATAISSNGFSRSYTVSYNANGGSVSPASATSTYIFNGWNASTSTPGYLVNDATERASTAVSSGYYDFASWTIAQPFVAGEKYRLEYDAYGSGTLTNYFYGNAGYLAVASITGSNGVTKAGSDGNFPITMTGSWTHYWVEFTLGSSGNGAVNKIILFRCFAGSTARIRNDL